MILLFSVSRLSLFPSSVPSAPIRFALCSSVDCGLCVGGLQVPENCLIDMMEEQAIFCCPIIVITILLTNASIYLCFNRGRLSGKSEDSWAIYNINSNLNQFSFAGRKENIHLTVLIFPYYLSGHSPLSPIKNLFGFSKPIKHQKKNVENENFTHISPWPGAQIKKLFLFGDFPSFSSTTNCQCSVWPEAVEEKGTIEEPQQGVLSYRPI